MFIEGYIDREFLRVITEAGYDVIWKCETQDDVRKHGYEDAADRDGIDISKETIARIFLYTDMEDYLMPVLRGELGDYGTSPQQDSLRKKLLPLMAVSNERMRNFAAEQLKG
jgi:hypothetical protein